LDPSGPVAALPSRTPLAITVAGEALTINGDTIDFSVVPEAGRIADAWKLHPMLAGTVERIDGLLHVTVLLPYSGADGHVEPPSPVLDPPDGPLTLPVIGGA
jgi:hypothetical protein